MSFSLVAWLWLQCYASWLGDNGAYSGVRAWQTVQSCGWEVVSIPLAEGGNRRVDCPRGWDGAALVAVAENDMTLSLVDG